MATLADQTLFEQVIGPDNVAQLLNDVGGVTADATLLSSVLERASKKAESIMLNAFDDLDTLADLFAADVALQECVCFIAADYAAFRRPGFIKDDGSTLYSAARKEAEKHLKLVAETHRRSRAEKTEGENPMLETDTNRPDHEFTFAATNADQTGPGGF